MVLFVELKEVWPCWRKYITEDRGEIKNKISCGLPLTALDFVLVVQDVSSWLPVVATMHARLNSSFYKRPCL